MSTTKPSKGAGAATAAKGLVLNLPGAPNTWHTVDGFDALFHPEHPTLLDDAGISVERAKAAHEAPGTHLELVDVADPDAARAVYAEAIGHSRVGVLDAIDHKRMTTPGDVAQARAELAIEPVTTPEKKE
jgi:hypothetical protein